MPRLPHLLSALAVLGLALLLGAAAPEPSSAASPDPAPAPLKAEVPRTIILGFDGMDHGLAERFMNEGLLPNFSKLAQQGTFQRLETSNPAQSPVSWAVFNTGTNPGKTGVGGFVSRYFAKDPDGNRVGNPLPQPMLGFATTIPANDFVPFAMALENPELFTGLAALLPLLLLFGVFKFLFRTNVMVALVVGLLAATGGWYVSVKHVASLPATGEVPYEINPMQGTNWWSYLDQRGVRLTGVQVASTFPPDTEGPNTRLLSGLGVKDIGGSPGSWYVFTDDPWSWSHGTDTAGKIVKISFDQNDETRAQIDLSGPQNWLLDGNFKKKIEALEAQAGHRDNTKAETERLDAELRNLRSEYNKWMRNGKLTTVPLIVDVDRVAGTLAFDVGGEKFSLEAGGWSDFIQVEFVFNELFSAHAVARFHLISCDEEEVRIFVPPVNIDPYHPSEYMPISSPPGFSAELAHGIGHAFETLGWACMTNPLKDTEDSQFNAQSFMDDIASTMDRREQLLAWNLDNAGDWDVFYQVLSTTDRIGHMLYREFDPEHPEYDEAYANTVVSAWGRQFPLKDALPEVYKEADRIVGDVMGRIASGDLGPDCLLLIVADHGFTSFRRGVNLNNLLAEMGYLTFKDDQTLKEVLESGNSDLLGYVDWTQTKAYSMGLGKVFINLKGREPKGIVPQNEYEATIKAIQADLLAVTDGPNGPKVVTSAHSRAELFDGPWVAEGATERLVRGEVEIYEHDGFADMFLGFEPYYRVSWSNTLGGLDKASIVNNTKHWSGGHVSVDPEHVAGVFFANQKFTEPARAGLLDIGPTVLERYGVPISETDVDGVVLPLAGN
jgi:predicted AlkP superfamily phosphohydrolase/phosphomutase